VATVLINEEPRKVRLVGVLSPLYVGCAENKALLLKKAIYFVRNLMVNEYVWIQRDPNLPWKDEEGHLVAYLYRVPDKLPLNLEIVRQGHGLAVRHYGFTQQQVFSQYEQKAQADRKGIWIEVAEAAQQ
jgi:endonuclease YncB( thermonuclease family)